MCSSLTLPHLQHKLPLFFFAIWVLVVTSSHSVEIRDLSPVGSIERFVTDVYMPSPYKGDQAESSKYYYGVLAHVVGSVEEAESRVIQVYLSPNPEGFQATLTRTEANELRKISKVYDVQLLYSENESGGRGLGIYDDPGDYRDRE